MYHKRQLQNMKKENNTIRDYLFKVKSICDSLDAACHGIPESEQVLIILNGLTDDYESVVVVISSQKSLPELDDVYSILLAHEARLDNKRPQEHDYSINFAANNKNKIQN